jgi:hypothetical protein
MFQDLMILYSNLPGLNSSRECKALRPNPSLGMTCLRTAFALPISRSSLCSSQSCFNQSRSANAFVPCISQRTLDYAKVLMCHSTARISTSEAVVLTVPAEPTLRAESVSLEVSKGSPRPGKRFYVNLTNGIEALPALSDLVPPGELRFTRLQSSHCEASAWDKVLAEIDHDLLWSLSTGCSCYLFDLYVSLYLVDSALERYCECDARSDNRLCVHF